MPSIAFHTLGCKLNFSETSFIAAAFEKEGYERRNFDERADIYVLNTCSVTEQADSKCRQAIRRAIRRNPHALIAVTGCYAQLKPEAVAVIPGVSYVLGAQEKFSLPEILRRRPASGNGQTKGPLVLHSPVSQNRSFFPSWSSGDRTRAFLKVQDGCDYHCSFCTIPLARGKSRSGTAEQIVRQAQEIAGRGIKEIVLSGVNVGDFGKHEEGGGDRRGRAETFLELLRRLEEIREAPRFRISSIEPNLLTDEILFLVAQSQRLMPHFHIPLQSGCNKTLRRMRRRYDREQYAGRVNKIKSLMPHACIGADVIAGFPGESEEDFLESYRFINELPLSYLHVFTYSERANTDAPGVGEAVPVPARRERTRRLINLSEKKRCLFYESHIGSRAHVLFEEPSADGTLCGFTENYIRVRASVPAALTNCIARVTLQEVDRDGKGLYMNGREHSE